MHGINQLGGDDMENKDLINMIRDEIKNHSCDVCKSKMLLVEKLEWLDKNLKGVVSCCMCDNWQPVKFNIYQVIASNIKTII